MKSVYKEYFIAVVGGIALIIFTKLPAKLSGTFLCPSSSQLCEYSWTLAILLIVPFLIVVLYNFLKNPLIQFFSRMDARQPTSLPNIPTPVGEGEIKKLFKRIEKLLDERGRLLAKSGIKTVKHKEKDGSCFYRFLYNNNLVYHFSMMPKTDSGPTSIGFCDGWSEPVPDSFTAFGRIQATLDMPKPTISLTANLSLITTDNLLPIQVKNMTYDGFAELVWQKAKRIIESRMRQRT